MWASLGLYLIYYFSLSVTAGGSCGMKSKQQASSGTDCCSALELIAFPKFSCLIPVAFCKTCFFSSIVSWLTVLCWIIEVRSLASQDTVLELWFLRIIWGSFILLQVWLGFFLMKDLEKWILYAFSIISTLKDLSFMSYEG